MVSVVLAVFKIRKRNELMLHLSAAQIDAVGAATECLKSYVLTRQPNGAFAVNFRSAMWIVMQEARHLDQLGVRDAPPAVINVALHKVRGPEVFLTYCSFVH